MSDIKDCQICGYKEASFEADYDVDTAFYTCPVCGRYQLTINYALHRNIDKSKLASYLFYKRFKSSFGKIEYRYHTTLPKEKCDEYIAEKEKEGLQHGHPVHMDEDIINSWYPKSFAEKIDMILLKLDEIGEYIGQKIKLSKYEWFGLTFVERYRGNTNEKLDENILINQAFFMMNYLRESGYIDGGASVGGDYLSDISITAEGYQRIDRLRRNSGEGRNVLVAMKFGEDTMNLRNAIKMGIRDAGYNPILIDEVEHNELITPELLSYIRNSRFVVVDLTHKNNGAYFEEGYAMGLGKPVIQLCKNGTELHFDIAQKNTIMWDSEDDIPLRLKNRIKATID
ncbi:hypothetical protein [Butyrivibrio sp. FC2001]|uniref:hypothetical protein n=1 Tax=Butyrivibrio sp. FC2001 TaxID=1280671 RepID=UPI0003FD8F48|nr:hypothetical protein [Butyrivibrio sp. FC2001]